MNPFKLNSAILFCALITLGLSAVGIPALSIAETTPQPPPPPPRKQSRDAYREELGRLLKANPPACAKLADCVAIPVGARACGGPTEFLVTSKLVLGKLSTEISDLTKAIAELDRAINAERQMMGICSIVTEPPLSCHNRLCAAQ